MMPKKKVLFIDTTHPYLIEGLKSLGFDCEQFSNYSRSDYQKIAHDYFGIIIRSRFSLDKAFLESATNLAFIARVGSGMENVDTGYALLRGIVCINAPEGNRDAVGEHALGMLLALFNNMITADKQVRQRIWKREENRGVEIMGKTIALIGYGNTGSAFAERLKGFHANVIAYDKYRRNFSDEFVKEVTMEEIFSEADVLSLHVPLTGETSYLINDDYIRSFKKNFFLINTARGKVVDTAALVRNLKSGKVPGAALDVLEYENIAFEDIEKQELKDDFLWLSRAENVILSPHVAGLTNESSLKLARVILEKIKANFN